MEPPFYDGGDVLIYCQDSRSFWQELPRESVDALITSPPYFGLRDYGDDRQIGLEETVDEYVDGLVELLNNYGRNTLKPTGSIWLNVGDSYAGTGARGTDGPGRNSLDYAKHQRRTGAADLPAKCLLMVPERIAWGMVSHGWLLRNKVIWRKTTHMPHSVTDRLTTGWEYVFHFTRISKGYFYDLDAIREPHKTITPDGPAAPSLLDDGADPMGDGILDPLGANPGDVWDVAPSSYRGAHFATFPVELIRRPLLATVPEKVCQECGHIAVKRYEKTVGKRDSEAARKHYAETTGRTDGYTPPNGWTPAKVRFLGWDDCDCQAYKPGIVIDPFFGSGTTGHAARQQGRRCWGIELNRGYAEMASKRFVQPTLFSEANS